MKREESSKKEYTKLAFGMDEQLYPGNGKQYGLHIDDVAYWSKVLSVEEIKQVMNRGMSVLCCFVQTREC